MFKIFAQVTRHFKQNFLVLINYHEKTSQYNINEA